MPKIVVQSQGQTLKIVHLNNRQNAYTVGSGGNSDILLHAENIADTHLQIDNRNGNFYLEPLDETTEVQINGGPLKYRRQLMHGDQIVIGDHTLTFESRVYNNLDQNEELEVIGEDTIEDDRLRPPAAEHATARTETMSPPSTEAGLVSENTADEFYEIEELPEDEVLEPPGFDATRPHSNNKQSAYCLLTIFGPYLGHTYPLKLADNRIGRDNSLNDIVIRNTEEGALDPSISRRHATLAYRQGQFFVSDKRSKTRTYLNQTKLEPGDELAVQEGDEIEIVSDQKSTIFRMCSRATPDSGLPGKAGTWRIRNLPKTLLAATALFGCAALTTFGISCNMRSPAPVDIGELKFFEETWYLDESSGEPTSERQGRLANLAVADFNGDGEVNVLFSEASGRLKLLNGLTKNTVWSNDHLAIESDFPIVVADLNDNRLPDALVLGTDGRLRALDGLNGAEIWLGPIIGAGITGAPVVFDFDGDGLQDVLVCTSNGKVHIGHGDIFRLSWRTLETGLQLSGVAAAADFDNDGRGEAFVGTADGKIAIVDGAAATLRDVYDFGAQFQTKGGATALKHMLRSPIALLDLSGDDSPDLVVGATSGNFLALEGQALRKLWQEKLHSELNSDNATLSLAAGDLNGDGSVDLVLSSNRALKAVNGVGQVLWEHYADEQDFYVTPTSLVDLNHDGSTDVLVGTQQGSVLAFNGSSGKLISQIHIDANAVNSAILAADMGGDGLLNLILRRQDGHIYTVKTNSELASADVVWGQTYADAQHTGVSNYQPPGATSYVVVASIFMLLFGVAGGVTYKSRQARNLRIELRQSAAAEPNPSGIPQNRNIYEPYSTPPKVQ